MSCCKNYVLNNEKDENLKKEIKDYLLEFSNNYDKNQIFDLYHRVYPNSKPTTYDNALSVLRKHTNLNETIPTNELLSK
jgi:hypothetical protein